MNMAKATQNAVEIAERAILFNLHQTYRPDMTAEELYEATRGVWIVSRRRGANAKYAFAIYKNVVREVYEIDSWHVAGTTSYRTRQSSELKLKGRSEFIGRRAPDVVRSKYVGNSVADGFRRGASNPIHYVNC